MKSKLRVCPLEELNQFVKNTKIAELEIKITEVGEDYLAGTMPVDRRTHQAYGLLHGGASVLFAETLGSIGAMLTVDHTRNKCVIVDVNASHIKAVQSGFVTGIAKPVHTGRSTQVWQIEIQNEAGDIVCVSRLTVAVRPL